MIDSGSDHLYNSHKGQDQKSNQKWWFSRNNDKNHVIYKWEYKRTCRSRSGTKFTNWWRKIRPHPVDFRLSILDGSVLVSSELLHEIGHAFRSGFGKSENLDSLYFETETVSHSMFEWKSFDSRSISLKSIFFFEKFLSVKVSQTFLIRHFRLNSQTRITGRFLLGGLRWWRTYLDTIFAQFFHVYKHFLVFTDSDRE